MQGHKPSIPLHGLVRQEILQQQTIVRVRWICSYPVPQEAPMLLRLSTAFACSWMLGNHALNLLHCACRVLNLHDDLIISFVGELDYDRFFGISDIPKDALALLVIRTCNDDAWQMCARCADSFPKSSRHPGVSANASEIALRNFQAALESPQFIPSLNLQD